MMLCLEKSTLGQFGAQEMMGLIDSDGLGAVLPDALNDQQLLLVSDQFRDLLAGKNRDADPSEAPAALPLTLLLLAEAGAKRTDDFVEVELETVREALSLLSVAFDREIVNRMLKRREGRIVGTRLMQGLESLVQHPA